MIGAIATIQSHPMAIYITEDLGVNKGSAIRFLQEYLGIAPDETCTFGDNLNDIEMLQSAGMSYAVSNAREEVIAAARDTCAPYWENGVLQVLKTFL